MHKIKTYPLKKLRSQCVKDQSRRNVSIPFSQITLAGTLFHAPAAAICWSTYEASKNFLQHWNVKQQAENWWLQQLAPCIWEGTRKSDLWERGSMDYLRVQHISTTILFTWFTLAFHQLNYSSMSYVGIPSCAPSDTSP